MTTLLLAASALCAAANAFIAAADWAKAKFVLANSAEVGLRPAVLPYLAALKAAGAAGLLAGFAGAPWLGLAAGIGLVLFFVGAVAAHVRARVLRNVAVPGLYLLLAAAAAAYFAGRV